MEKVFKYEIAQKLKMATVKVDGSD